MGYLSENGEYHPDDNPGRIQRFLHPPAIFDHDPNFAEQLISNTGTPLIYGLSRSELFNQFFSAMQDRRTWSTILDGAISYPEDIYWYAYTVAARQGALGPRVHDRVAGIWDHAFSLVREATSRTINLTPEAVGYLSDSGLTTEAYYTYLGYAGNIYANHLINGGALHMVGRIAAGTATRYILALLVTKGLGTYFPPAAALSTTMIARHPALTQSLMLMTKIGAVTRAGENMLDKYDSLNRWGMLDLMVTLTTGEADPKDVNEFQREAHNDFDVALNRMWEDVNRRHWDMATTPNYRYDNENPLTILDQDINRLRYHSIPGREDAFIDRVAHIHSMAVRLHRMGYRSDAIDRVRTLGDPTFTVFFRTYMASLTSVMGSILQMPDNSRWWNMAMQQDLERLRNLNDRGATLGAESE